MNIHPRRLHYDTVEYSIQNPRRIVQSCVGYWVCFGTRGVVLCRSGDVEIVQGAGSDFNMGGNGNGGIGGKKGYIYWRCCYFLVQLVRYDEFDSYAAFCWLMNMKLPRLDLTQPPGTSWMRNHETRFSSWGEASSWWQVLLLHHIPLLPFRPCASPSKLSSS